MVLLYIHIHTHGIRRRYNKRGHSFGVFVYTHAKLVSVVRLCTKACTSVFVYILLAIYARA